ncbi:MAG TPA: LLM class flavin-dependent oxidoreductase [Frankiaceae bacterium]|nr:LLM class flavin-dependent oxidoreductase [Frankiaceae bacterium]
MAFFTMRFDLRNPAFAGVPIADRYAAALEMTEYADRNGFLMVIISEHHGSPDGYLPSALPFAAAVAARTKNVRILVAALVSAFHDPLKVAEDAAVIDAISGGRLDLVVTNGYVQSEFDMFGVPLKQRAARTTELLETLQNAFTGEPFTYRGRTVQVTPAPVNPGGPPLQLGGSSKPAAQRAARMNAGFMPSGEEIWEHYRAEVIELGRDDPGAYLGGDTSFFHVTEDIDRGWELIGPHALHEANSYGKWMVEAGIGAEGGYTPFEDLEQLKATGQYRVITPQELIDELKAGGPFASATLHPMMGGIPPEVAWESLRLIQDVVIPAVK